MVVTVRQCIKTIIRIFVGFLIIWVATNNTQAMKLPSEYGENQCLIVANDVKTEFGGETVLLYPNTYPEQIGHWINKKKIGNNTYYIDYRNQMIFNSREVAIDWYVSLGKETGRFTSAIMIEDDYRK